MGGEPDPCIGQERERDRAGKPPPAPTYTQPSALLPTRERISAPTTPNPRVKATSGSILVGSADMSADRVAGHANSTASTAAEPAAITHPARPG